MFLLSLGAVIVAGCVSIAYREYIAIREFELGLEALQRSERSLGTEVSSRAELVLQFNELALDAELLRSRTRLLPKAMGRICMFASAFLAILGALADGAGSWWQTAGVFSVGLFGWMASRYWGRKARLIEQQCFSYLERQRSLLLKENE
ncbi:MAG: hypothetical protein MK135_09935 [Polyangiaceae bacterium]|nr:hypothetical protein [Polyangiaceae bacterium]